VTEGGIPGYMGGGSATLLMLRLLVRPCSESDDAATQARKALELALRVGDVLLTAGMSANDVVGIDSARLRFSAAHRIAVPCKAS
jgi:hypothetical protein